MPASVVVGDGNGFQLLLDDQVVAEGVASDSPAARDALVERTRAALTQLAEA